MKRLVLLMAVMLVFGGMLFAGGAKEDELRGTWYGGSSNPDNAGYKYQYTFVPTGRARWYAMADGAYNPDSLGAAVATRWTGEVVRRNGVYEIRLIALTTNDPTEPPEELPSVQAVRGRVTFDEDDAVQIVYDLYAIYDWGQTPFVDQPGAWFLAPGEGVIEESLMRMQSEVPFE
ncbi:MAG TPA: hypothetical protein VKA06_00530 [Spirochaetia bacterium]|nr:hypothetical protein [Spirochaetia bacterium]